MTAPGSTVRFDALKVLGGYLVFATMLAVWSGMRGDGGFVAVAAYVILLVVITIVVRSDGKTTSVLRDWLPLLALPVLYGAIPRTAIGVGPFDNVIQELDRLVFRTDPARTFAGTAPWWPLSELLHASYLSYYAIIYVPPLLMFVRGDRRMFERTVYAFVLAMVACFTVFCVFPVEGPRYVWPSPTGVPDGMFRRTVSAILQGGSSRGTAFPSSHQAIALVMSLSSFSWKRWLGLSLLVVSALLGLGAVYGGFHYGADMIFGAGVGFAVWLWISPRRKAALA